MHTPRHSNQLCCENTLPIWLGVCFVFAIAIAGFVMSIVALVQNNNTPTMLQKHLDSVIQKLPQPQLPHQDECKWDLQKKSGELTYECADSLLLRPKKIFTEKDDTSMVGSFLFVDPTQNISRAGIEFKKEGPISTMDFVLQVGREQSASPFTIQYDKDRQKYAIGIGQEPDTRYGLDVETESIFRKGMVSRRRTFIDGTLVVNCSSVSINRTNTHFKKPTIFSALTRFTGPVEFVGNVSFPNISISFGSNSSQFNETINKIQTTLSSQTRQLATTQTVLNEQKGKLDNVTNEILQNRRKDQEQDRKLDLFDKNINVLQEEIVRNSENLVKIADDLSSLKDVFHGPIIDASQLLQNVSYRSITGFHTTHHSLAFLDTSGKSKKTPDKYSVLLLGMDEKKLRTQTYSFDYTSTLMIHSSHNSTLVDWYLEGDVSTPTALPYTVYLTLKEIPGLTTSNYELVNIEFKLFRISLVNSGELKNFADVKKVSQFFDKSHKSLAFSFSTENWNSLSSEQAREKLQIKIKYLVV